ncbi:MAG TPA: 6-phosphogluconolactonase [Phycisphaerales bacterium]|nr:6-phosphogluconolactonase [Phycisphaerales bacterium]HMP38231.1 6-phosphogluconolactonase [Phycisphaerales bacterium]
MRSTPDNRTIVVHADPEALAEGAARRIELLAAEAIAARGRFIIALAGGSTPKRTYELLARRGAQIDWRQVYVVVGDERLVPRGDPQSNFGMAQEALLSRIPIPAAHVFPVPVELDDEARIAATYADLLTALAGDEPGPPKLDLILLGLGSDGHTASLFPGHPALDERSAWVVATAPGTLPPPVRRVTMTFPVLNAARHVLFLVAGSDKSEALAAIISGDASVRVHPAVAVRPERGTLEWYIDRAAAALLPAERSDTA